jgi:hypothetical protein
MRAADLIAWRFVAECSSRDEQVLRGANAWNLNQRNKREPKIDKLSG